MRVFVADGGRHLAPTGYGRVARSVIHSLEAEAVDFEISDPGKPGIEGLPYHDGGSLKRFDVALQIGQPAAAKKFPIPSGMFTMTDTIGLPEAWRTSLRQCDFLLTPSRQSEQSLKSVGPPVLRVPLYVDLSTFSPQPKWRSEGSEKLSLVTVGTWSFRKGIDLLVEGFVQAFDASEARLTIISTESAPDSTFNGLLRLLNEMGKLGDFEIVTKYVSDAWLSRYFARSDAYVTCTRGEGWGYPAMEAAACGLPVLSPMAISIDDFTPDRPEYRIATETVPTANIHADFGRRFSSTYSDPDISIVEASIGDVASALQRLARNREQLSADGMGFRQHLLDEDFAGKFPGRLVEAIRQGLASASHTLAPRPSAATAATLGTDGTDAGTCPSVDIQALAKRGLAVSVPEDLSRRLEIAAGSKPQPGYLHHDIRPLPDIDIVCDARSFPVEHRGTFDEVYASNILEHFNRFEVESVLKEWVSLLRPGGLIKVIVPDVGEIARQYAGGMIDHEFFVYLMYGGQDYEFNRHYYGFDTGSLEQMFARCSLTSIDVKPGKAWEKRSVDRYCPMIQASGRVPA